jgi:hypothetical protein
MRFRLIATYLGATYQAALGPDREDVTLFAACPPPEELGFSSAAGHWRKLVGIDDLEGLRQSRPVGLYRGARCLVLDDQGDRLHITYLGDDADQARELGYWEIDREVFEMVVPRADVIDLFEAQTDIPVEAVIIPPLLLAAPTAMAGPAQPRPGPGEEHNQDQGQDYSQDQDQDHGQDHNQGRDHNWGQAQDDQREFQDQYQDHDQYPDQDEDEDADDYRASDRMQPSSNGHRTEPSRNGHRTLDRMAAWHGSPEPWSAQEQFTTMNGHGHPNGNGTRPAGSRAARRERVPIQAVFAELTDLAAIPQSAYALEDEIPGAMCLIKTDDGFEVFASSDDARHEVRFFEDEEAAYFYLFGVLVAESVRNGRLLPAGSTHTAAVENISKYLRARNSHNSPPNPVRVLIAGGADGPPLPKQPRRPP